MKNNNSPGLAGAFKIAVVCMMLNIQLGFGMEQEGVKEEALYTLPSANVLRERLNENGFGYFMEKTKIVEQLAGQQQYALGVAVTVECALYDFNEYLKNPTMAAMMNRSKSKLVETILKDNPKAIEELKGHNIIQ